MITENTSRIFKILTQSGMHAWKNKRRRSKQNGMSFSANNVYVGNALTAIPAFITDDFDSPEETITLCEHLIKCRELSA